MIKCYSGVAVIKYHSRRNLAEVEVGVFQLTGYSSSLREAIHGVSSNRNLATGTEAEAMEGKLPTGLLSMSCSECFLIQLRATCPVVAPSTVDRAHSYQQLIIINKNHPEDMPTVQSDGGNPQLKFLFISESSLYQVDKN